MINAPSLEFGRIQIFLFVFFHFNFVLCGPPLGRVARIHVIFVIHYDPPLDIAIGVPLDYSPTASISVHIAICGKICYTWRCQSIYSTLQITVF